MRKKVYHLKSCSTCQRILSELPLDGFEIQNIKDEAMTEEQVDEMATLAGSYEALFSRVAMKYKAWGLKEKSLDEKDYRDYILQEYTFLKRPVFLIGDTIFIGNSKKNVAAVKEALEG